MISPPRSAVGTITAWGLLGKFYARALFFGIPAIICAILTFFPERYLADATLAPTDPASLGLSGTLGQLGALNNVFGNQAAIEIAMNVGEGQDVREAVIKQTNLEQRLGRSRLQTHRWLAKRVEIRSLRGGIIQVNLQDRDPSLAIDIVTAYTSEIRSRLAEISRQQTSYKRGILEKLVSDATQGLADAQARYDAFRLQHQDTIPEGQTSLVAQRIGELEGAIRSNRVNLAIARKIYTDDNYQIKELEARTSALDRQLAEAKATQPSDIQNVGTVVASTRVLFKLQRDVSLQRALYDNYMRFLQGTSVEDLASAANMRILQPPHIETDRQYWFPAMAAGIAVAMLWGAVEFYRMRPPLGAPRPAGERAEDAVLRRRDDEVDHA